MFFSPQVMVFDAGFSRKPTQITHETLPFGGVQCGRSCIYDDAPVGTGPD
jgi:hypothetical protein